MNHIVVESYGNPTLNLVTKESACVTSAEFVITDSTCNKNPRVSYRLHYH